MDEKPRKRFQFGLKALLALVLIFSVGAAIHRANRKDDGYRALDDMMREEHSGFKLVHAQNHAGPYIKHGVWYFSKGSTMQGAMGPEGVLLSA